MTAYYNEIEPFAAEWLRRLMAAGEIMDGVIDDRDIREVRADDLRGFTRVHLFAGIGGWDLALRLAGWPDDRPVWTGSCPCQPFSVAGPMAGTGDARHLWPHMFRLIGEHAPATIVGEQVDGRAGREWLAGVRADLESAGYAFGAADLPAAGVGAPHRRQRLWWLADAADAGRKPGQRARHAQGQFMVRPERQQGPTRTGGGVPDGILADTDGEGLAEWQGECGDPCEERSTAERSGVSGFWGGGEWRGCADGRSRRVEPGIRLLADGFPGRVDLLRAFGNAIVPQVGSIFVRAAMMAMEDDRCE